MSTGVSASAMTVQFSIHIRRGQKGRIELLEGRPPAEAPVVPRGRVPRISRLMALAIRFEGMLQRGEVKDYAELARLGHVTRARLTQIMNLSLLAPDIQEQLLFLPLIAAGRDPIREWQIRPIAAETLWHQQRRKWGELASRDQRQGSSALLDRPTKDRKWISLRTSRNQLQPSGYSMPSASSRRP